MKFHASKRDHLGPMYGLDLHDVQEKISESNKIGTAVLQPFRVMKWKKCPVILINICMIFKHILNGAEVRIYEL